jgi:hypothetical protein
MISVSLADAHKYYFEVYKIEKNRIPKKCPTWQN